MGMIFTWWLDTCSLMGWSNYVKAMPRTVGEHTWVFYMSSFESLWFQIITKKEKFTSASFLWVGWHFSPPLRGTFLLVCFFLPFPSLSHFFPHRLPEVLFTREVSAILLFFWQSLLSFMLQEAGAKWRTRAYCHEKWLNHLGFPISFSPRFFFSCILWVLSHLWHSGLCCKLKGAEIERLGIGVEVGTGPPTYAFNLKQASKHWCLRYSFLGFSLYCVCGPKDFMEKEWCLD